MTLGYFWNAELLQRETGSLCPESPERVERLNPSKLFATPSTDIVHTQFSAYHPNILSLAHDDKYVREIRDEHANGKRYLNARDTQVTEDVFDQALLAASAGCAAIDKIVSGEMSAAFCAIRPPGHHANQMRALGFCIFNNAAIAARYAQSRHGIDRVLIVDWDVHPGNGTQEIFWRDPTVFTLSFHQEDLLGASGKVGLVGAERGEGFNRNVVFKPGTGARVYLDVFEKVVDHVAHRFRPELLIISAGFDAHQCDSISQMNLTENDYARMTEILTRITRPFTNGRTLSMLEGGYNVAVLMSCVRSHCEALSRSFRAEEQRLVTTTMIESTPPQHEPTLPEHP